MSFEDKDLNKEEVILEESINAENSVDPLVLVNQRLTDQLSRLTADFENFRRRNEIDKRNWYISAKGEVIIKLLPFFDEVTLAIVATKKSEIDNTEMIKGLELIATNFFKSLVSMGISEVSYESFDPELHEALAKVPGLDKESGSIVEVLKKGFLLDGKILRHAQVIVAE